MKKNKYHQLTSEQRSQIFAYLRCGMSVKFIAEQLNVHISTIYREIKRNANKYGRYAYNAHEMAMERRERTVCNRAIKPWDKQKCLRLLMENQWSPEQISGHLAKEGVKVSHTTIYKWVKEDKAANGDLFKNLRHMGKRRKSNPYKNASAKNIPNRTSISERPAEADGRRFGDWEMDLIIGKNGYQAILVLVERSSGYVIIRRLNDGKKADGVARTVIQELFAYKSSGVLTITTDNGCEFSKHEKMTKSLNNAKVYFADPYSSWQKGLVEYTNKLIRQYIPKGADFDLFSDKDIMAIQKKLNNRPRKKLNYSTPKVAFFSHFN